MYVKYVLLHTYITYVLYNVLIGAAKWERCLRGDIMMLNQTLLRMLTLAIYIYLIKGKMHKRKLITNLCCQPCAPGKPQITSSPYLIDQ